MSLYFHFRILTRILSVKYAFQLLSGRLYLERTQKRYVLDTQIACRISLGGCHCCIIIELFSIFENGNKSSTSENETRFTVESKQKKKTNKCENVRFIFVLREIFENCRPNC